MDFPRPKGSTNECDKTNLPGFIIVSRYLKNMDIKILSPSIIDLLRPTFQVQRIDYNNEQLKIVDSGQDACHANVKLR